MADFSAFVFEGIADGCALFVQEVDLFGDFVVLGFCGLLSAGEFRRESFIFRGGINVRFFFFLLLDVFTEIFRVSRCETRLITAPGLQSIKLDVKRPRDRED
jgi:hypothetical protein